MGVRALKKGTQVDDDEQEKAEDKFVALVQGAMEAALKREMDAKEQNALFANCIKFIAVKNKLRGEEGDFFNNDD